MVQSFGDGTIFLLSKISGHNPKKPLVSYEQKEGLGWQDLEKY